MAELIAILAQPYTDQELTDFEQLIFASNADNPKIRMAGRVALAVFFKEHGKAKCDLMMQKLDLKWTATRGNA